MARKADVLNVSESRRGTVSFVRSLVFQLSK